MTETREDIFEAADLDVLQDAASYHLRVLNLTISRFLESVFAGTPLEGGTGKVTTLIMAMTTPGITAAEIAPFAGKDAPAMTRLVARFVEAGLLRREADPSSRRRQLLYITPRGEALIGLIRQAIARERDEVFGTLSDGELGQLLRILKKLNAAHIARTETAQASGDEAIAEPGQGAAPPENSTRMGA